MKISLPVSHRRRTNATRVVGIAFAAVAATTLAGADIFAQSASAEAAYERTAKAYAALRSVDAEFEQKISNPLLGKTAISRGRFIQQRPNLVSITFTDPVGDRIVGDGISLWVYLPSSTPGQVIKLPADAEGAGIVNLLGQLLDAPRQSLVISGGDAVTIDGVETRRVLLVPRVANRLPFQRATLWIDDKDARVRRMQVLDGQGIDRTITMLTWNTNVTPARDVFRFTPPKGVKVVTGPG